MVRLVASRIGFSFRRSAKYSFHKAPELVGLRFLGELDPLRSRFEPTFWGVEFPESLVKWNRDMVLKQRMHIIPCPRGYTEPCRRCTVGYGADEGNCPGSVHKFAYTRGRCNVCQKDNQWFDPEVGLDRCTECSHKDRTRRR